MAAPGSPAATHCTSAPCATAPQSLALRGRPASSPSPEQRRLAAGPAGRSPCPSQKPYLLEESSPGRLPGLVWLEV